MSLPPSGRSISLEPVRDKLILIRPSMEITLLSLSPGGADTVYQRFHLSPFMDQLESLPEIRQES